MLVSYWNEVVNMVNVFRFIKGETGSDFYIRFYRDKDNYTTFNFGNDKVLRDKVYNDILGNTDGGCLRYQKEMVEEPVEEKEPDDLVNMENVIMNSFYNK